MNKSFMALTLGVGALILATNHAFGQTQNCGAREHVVQRLSETYGETRQSIGLGPNNRVVEVYASEETGTWTITVTSPNGVTCLVASGQAYESLAEALPTKGSDA